ncbi:hypothetical protein BCT62_09750 [Vibrio splendidus]|uniref:SEC-C metal-binding domain-containing protein n=1 Tax=Vibrio splendidus TaxID=29497 RepID=UPI000C86649C|nr:SEC-C metal-binding domain-containing protein [Vibrio splendidus]PMM11645.1 hypothetical protein BCT62_09750 [Vibrio splendidus]
MEILKHQITDQEQRIVYRMGERPENTLRELLEEGFVSQKKFINIRPKQRCPCGSKKKFKKCCGRLLEDK